MDAQVEIRELKKRVKKLEKTIHSFVEVDKLKRIKLRAHKLDIINKWGQVEVGLGKGLITDKRVGGGIWLYDRDGNKAVVLLAYEDMGGYIALCAPTGKAKVWLDADYGGKIWTGTGGCRGRPRDYLDGEGWKYD